MESLSPILIDVSNGVSSDTSACIVIASDRPSLIRLSLIGEGRLGKGVRIAELLDVVCCRSAVARGALAGFAGWQRDRQTRVYPLAGSLRTWEIFPFLG